MIAGLLALTVIAVSAAGLAVRDAASASRQHAIALSRELAAESLAADSADPLTARRLAVAAWRVFPTDQAGAALASLLMEQQQGGILPGNPANGGVNTGGVQPGRPRCWPPPTATATCGCGTRSPGRPSASPLPADTGLGGGVYGVAFSPDGKLLATGDAAGYRAAVEPGHRAGRRRSPPG